MRFYKVGWFHKLLALVIASGYFILLIFINNSSYVWATLALVFILFVTTFTCTTNDSPLSQQLRGTRLAGLLPRDGQPSQRGEEEVEEERSGETRIWMTDVPPSYSYVMELGPPTPPPSYGSALLLFPPPYSPGKDSPPRLRPLSISAQVSVSGSVPGTPQPGGRVTFSTQISVVEPLADTLSLRTRLFLSRQVSMEDLEEQAGGEGELRVRLSRQASREDGDVFADTLQLRTRLFLSREELAEQEPDGRRVLRCLSRQASRDDQPGGDVFAETLQLRTSLFLSRDPSSENLADEEELQTIDCQIPILLITDGTVGPGAAETQSEVKKEN